MSNYLDRLMELTAIVFFTSCYFLTLVPLGIHYMFGNDVMLRRLGEAQQADQGLSRWILEPTCWRRCVALRQLIKSGGSAQTWLGVDLVQLALRSKEKDVCVCVCVFRTSGTAGMQLIQFCRRVTSCCTILLYFLVLSRHSYY